MKQLGNLAVICAHRPELLMQLRGGLVLVQAKNLEMILGIMEHLQNKMDSIQTYQLM